MILYSINKSCIFFFKSVCSHKISNSIHDHNVVLTTEVHVDIFMLISVLDKKYECDMTSLHDIQVGLDVM
jgi:hypothetical protein